MPTYTTFQQRRYRYAVIGAMSVFILAVMLYSYLTSSRMINRYYPHVDAIMEIKVELTTGHLWLEEIIAGDRQVREDDIAVHLDRATWYARAMLEGGRNPEGVILPVNDAALRNEISLTMSMLEKFKEITRKRLEFFEESATGTPIDQRYDALYERIITQVDDVETLLQQKLREDYGKYKSLELLLIVVVAILSGLAFLLQYRYDLKLRDHVAELKAARERAEESENWLKTTMNSMGDGVIITDHKGVVTYLNPVASSLTGWLLGEAKNRKMTEVFNIVNEETKKPVDDPVQLVIKKNVVIGLANHTELISRDGTVWPISDSAAPIFDHDRNLIGVVVVFHEITAQKEAEREKAELEAQLRQAYKMEAIGTMAGGIAHDFNNVLAIILGNADLALDVISPGDAGRHNVEQVMAAATRAKDLVKQILTFSRKEERVKEPSYLCRLVDESCRSIRSTIPASVEMKVDIPLECRNDLTGCSMIMADPTQIHQLLLNLCVNGVQAMDEKGTLQVTVKEVQCHEEGSDMRPGLEPGTYEYLAVSDSGEGMNPKIVEQIFDPFFTTKDPGKGTGMGLAVVHGIIESHNGHIFVESEPGRGTIFHMYFPVTDIRPEDRPEVESLLPSGSERILFVDDEEMLADVGKEMLERLGYEVTAAYDSRDALDLFKKNPAGFDLVITDQTMPEMTGAELAEEMLRLRPGLPVILCTGYSSKVDKVKAKQIGISEFTSKPLSKKEIGRMVRQLLDSRSFEEA